VMLMGELPILREFPHRFLQGRHTAFFVNEERRSHAT
jgi:hypothetical protein